MIDPKLERRFADCNELLEVWRVFLDLVNRAVKPPKTTTPQLEQQFLNSKARIAMLHDSFVDSLKHDKQVGANMLQIVNRAITLRNLQKVTEAEARKMEIEWHEVYLLLNETVSTLNEERSKLAQVNEMAHNLKRFQEGIWVRSSAFLRSIYFKLIVFAVVMAFVIWGGPALGLYDWDRLRDVKQVRFAVEAYLDLSRNYLGLQSPYYDLESFTTLLNKPVANVSPEVRTDRNPQSNVAQRLPKDMRMYGADPGEAKATSDILSEAKGYAYIRYIADGGQPDCGAAIFFLRKTADAKKVMAQYDRFKNQVPDQYTIIRKVNVIVVLNSTSKTYLDEVRIRRFDPLKP